MFKESIPCTVESQLVGGLHSLLECKPLNSLLEGHLGGGLLSPTVMKRLVDSKLEFLSDEETLLFWDFVGVEVEPELLAVGNAISLPLDVESNRVVVMLVFRQALRDELHELTVLLPDIFQFTLLDPAATGVYALQSATLKW